MADPGLSQWLCEAVAQASVAAASPAEQNWPALAATLAQARGACSERPALRLWIQELQRESNALAASAAALPESLLDAILAALEWAEGRDPRVLGLEPAIDAVMARSGVPAGLRGRVIAKLQAEASAAAARERVAMLESAVELAGADTASSADAAALLPAAVHGNPGTSDSEALPASAPDTDPIWLAPEELEMLSNSIHGEVLPHLGDWAALALPRPLDDTLSFLLEAQRNTLDVLGLGACAQWLRCAESALWSQADGSDCADALAQWFVALDTCLQDPSSLAELLIESSDALGLTIAQRAPNAAIAAELARLRIGIDPRWLERPRRTLEDGDLDLSPAEDVIPSVLQGMLRELPAHSAALSEALARLRLRHDAEDLNLTRRITHTLKGDANTVGVRGLARLAHAMEDILVELGRRGEDWPPAISLILERAGDCLAAMADHVLGRGPVPEDAAEVLAEVYASADALERGEELPQTVETAETALVEAPASTPALAAPAPEPAKLAGAADESISVPRSMLDRLLRLSAESLALATQLRAQTVRQEHCRAEVLHELGALRAASQQLDEQVSFRGLALAEQRQREGQVDELELDRYNELYVASRRIQETQSDVRSRLHELEQVDTDLERLIQRKARIDEDLQSAVRTARLVPVREHRARFERTVRQTARTLSKAVVLSIEGAELRIDKVVLDALIDPLMHLLRNAVDHGIETPERRSAAGKAANGQLQLGFAITGQNLQVTLTDDGGGIDFEQVRRKGLREGWIGEDADQRTLTELLFRPGFSSRDQVTQVSGRGVGLDVVARNLRQIGGTVRVDSEPGRSTRFTIRIPLSLGTLQVAVVSVHQYAFALATDGFRGFETLSSDAFRLHAGHTEAKLGEEWLPLLDLGALLGQRPMSWPPTAKTVALVEDEFGARQLVAVEQVAGLSLVVLENLPTWLPSLAGVRGACVLGDGRAAPVLDLRELCRTRATRSMPEWSRMPERQAPLVVVADDSLTIRRALAELLLDAGYRVQTASDGLEALLVLEKHDCAALLVDLEMPRMNGLELTLHLRQSESHARLPVVMITSRSSDRHRELALGAGVNDLLTKPYSDDQVLTALAQLIQ